MLAFIVRRLIQTVVVLLLITFISFMLIHLIPGDPVITMLGAEAHEYEIEALRAELGLDKPIIVQYGNWLFNVLRGDLGKSIMYREDVASLVASRFPITLYIGSLAFILSALFGILAGVICAVRRGTFRDQGITVLANLGVAIPIFWLGILGIYAFALKLGWLPVQGFASPFENLQLSIRQSIMPIICLAVIPLALATRQARSAMLEVIQQDYIRTAWSKGLTERIVMIRHALKNALIPVITVMGVQLRDLIGGSVLVETVFNIPGMGRLIVRGVFDKDFVIVQAGVLVIGIAIALVNLSVDISYAYIDPRIRYE